MIRRSILLNERSKLFVDVSVSACNVAFARKLNMKYVSITTIACNVLVLSSCVLDTKNV